MSGQALQTIMGHLHPVFSVIQPLRQHARVRLGRSVSAHLERGDGEQVAVLTGHRHLVNFVSFISSEAQLW